MTLPRTVADVLARHVSFEVESIDRMYCNVYQPRLQYPGGAAAFFVGHRGFSYASSALMAQMTEVFVADLYHFIAAHDVPLVQFAKGQRKDDVTQQYLSGHDGSEQVLFVGRAQEKARVISSVRRRNPVTGAAYAWLVHTNALVNHFYAYCFDDDFGPVHPEVLFVLPVHREAVHQRQRVGQTAGCQGRYRVHRVGQRVRRCR
jgi:hypothetical protein